MSSRLPVALLCAFVAPAALAGLNSAPSASLTPAQQMIDAQRVVIAKPDGDTCRRVDTLKGPAGLGPAGRSPFFRVVTPGPASTTAPAPSWPKFAGSSRVEVESGDAPEGFPMTLQCSDVLRLPEGEPSMHAQPMHIREAAHPPRCRLGAYEGNRRTTACCRGYVATWSLRGGLLFLESVESPEPEDWFVYADMC